MDKFCSLSHTVYSKITFNERKMFPEREIYNTLISSILIFRITYTALVKKFDTLR